MVFVLLPYRNRTVKSRGWEVQSSQLGDKDIPPLVVLFHLLALRSIP